MAHTVRPTKKSIAGLPLPARAIVARWPSGLDTQLGPTGPCCVDVSFGQWQKLALARGFMRDHPLLLVLDEHALDAETEHALFERYAGHAQVQVFSSDKQGLQKDTIPVHPPATFFRSFSWRFATVSRDSTSFFTL